MPAAKAPRLVETRSGKKLLEGSESALRKHVEVNYPRSHEDNDPDVRLVLPDGTQEVYNAESGWQKGTYSHEEGWAPAEESAEEPSEEPSELSGEDEE
jgi:hypothetical protein